jgi:hypothetical protein
MPDKVQHFRTLAKDAEEKAKKATDAEAKRRLRQLADGWRRLADLFQADIDRLTRGS